MFALKTSTRGTGSGEMSGLHRRSKRVSDHLELAEQLLDRLRTTVNLGAATPEDPWSDLQLARANIDLANAKIIETRKEHP